MKYGLIFLFLFLFNTAYGQLESVRLRDLVTNTQLSDSAATLINKTIAAGSNTITGLTNSNLSGSAGITNANLANSSITINGSAVSLGSSVTIATNTTDTIYILGTGQSNMGGFDTTTGLTRIAGTDARIQSWNGSWVTANPTTNNIVLGFPSTTAKRNNVAFEFARNYIQYHPTSVVRILVYATGATGIHLWTPKTTGLGEVTTSNLMLDSVVSKVNAAVPSGKMISTIIWQQGEQQVTNNLVFANDSLIHEVYDTLINLAKVSDSAKFLANYPCGASTYDSLRVTFDSFLLGTKNIGRRNIIAVRHLYETTDGVHLTNDALAKLGRLDYNHSVTGQSLDFKKQDSTINYLTMSGSYNYLYSPIDLRVGGSSDPNNTYRFRGYFASSGTDNGLLLRSLNTGLGRQQALGVDLSTNVTAIYHAAERPGSTFRQMNYVNFRDSGSVQISDSASGEIASFGAASVRVSKPTTFTTAALFSSTSLFNNTLAVRTSNTTGDQVNIGTTGGSAGNEGGIRFTAGGSTSSAGSPVGWIRGRLGATGGGISLYYTANLSTATQGLMITEGGRVSIGTITAPTALTHIMAGSTSQAQLRLQGSVAPTSPNNGDIWRDTTSSGDDFYTRLGGGTYKIPRAVATGLVGTTTNDNAATGVVGEYVSSLVASGSAVSLTTATTANVTSLSLTAGDWDIEGNVNFSTTSATSTVTLAGVGSTSVTMPSDGSEVYSGVQLTLTSTTDGIAIPRKRISMSGSGTVYLYARATFSAGSISAFGSLTARRVR